MRRVEREHDASHPYALRARELYAHALMEHGDPAAAAEEYMAVAQVWGDEEYWENLCRACDCWGRVVDLALAEEMARPLLRLLRAGGGAEGDKLRRFVRARLHALSAGKRAEREVAGRFDRIGAAVPEARPRVSGPDDRPLESRLK
ncbi:hypothetical protein SAMN05216259_12739 [Actinacidiphila guanduensis]|uniref:Tetratricopeptide repeat protein n=1 Tax=Actinacidiphila guanduensis TaxID=310781 RepID=A0A1H0SDX4_9ACTN|nr:hypothetical protein SAMN05216259_12739 [Actinacidiphila guanduensis]